MVTRLRGGEIGEMDDRGLKLGRSLAGRSRHGTVVGGVGAQAVDRLRREGDEAPALECRGGRGDALAVGASS